GVDFFELPSSGNQAAMLDLENSAGNLDTGVWSFGVRGGVVSDVTGQYNYTVQDSAGATDQGTVYIHSAEGTSVVGGAGDDILISDVTDDVLTGGAGDDVFVFGPNSGNDTVTDFSVGADGISLEGGADFTGVTTADVNFDSVLDSVLGLTGGHTVTLLGVSGVVDPHDLLV
ncbi:MAG: hypothetical protein HY521_00605, partial [Proteobacteria bacterium]|nr:hypothetical protein [Pseudomonadota bacterium]